MGIEVAVMAALAASSIYSGVQKAKQEQKNAEATALEGTLRVEQMGRQAEQMRLNTARMAAKQKTSFLSSGVALEGSPFQVVSETYDLGMKDIKALGSDIGRTAQLYDMRSASYMSSARSAVIGGLVNAASSVASVGYGSGMFGGAENMAGQSSTVFGTTSTGAKAPIPARRPI